MKIYFMAEDEFPLMLDTENKTIQFLDSYAERQILRENEKRITNIPNRKFTSENRV